MGDVTVANTRLMMETDVAGMTIEMTDHALAFIKERTWPEYPSGTAPTVRELARRCRVRQRDIVDALENHDSVCMNVGFGTGGGVMRYGSIGDYSFEWMGG